MFLLFCCLFCFSFILFSFVLYLFCLIKFLSVLFVEFCLFILFCDFFGCVLGLVIVVVIVTVASYILELRLPAALSYTMLEPLV